MSYYGTLAEAEAYLLEHHFEAAEVWLPSDDTRREIALRKATQVIDQLNFQGDKADVSQSLEFPRGADTSVPTAVEEACYEIAYTLLDGRDLEYEAEMQNVNMTSFAGGRVRKDDNLPPIHTLHGVPSIVAWKLLVPFLREDSPIVLSRVM